MLLHWSYCSLTLSHRYAQLWYCILRILHTAWHIQKWNIDHNQNSQMTLHILPNILTVYTQYIGEKNGLCYDWATGKSIWLPSACSFTVCWFKIKIPSYQYIDSYYKEETVFFFMIIMEIPILVRWHFYIELVPRALIQYKDTFLPV